MQENGTTKSKMEQQTENGTTNLKGNSSKWNGNKWNSNPVNQISRVRTELSFRNQITIVKSNSNEPYFMRRYSQMNYGTSFIIYTQHTYYSNLMFPKNMTSISKWNNITFGFPRIRVQMNPIAIFNMKAL